MTARWGEPVRRPAAPVMVAAPAVSTDDVTRLLERREARPTEDVVEPAAESPVATLLARREGRAPVPADAQHEGVEDDGSSPVEALLARRAESRRQSDVDLPVDAVSVAGLIAAREARATAAAAASVPDPSVDALLARRAARVAEPAPSAAEPVAQPDAASPSLDALLSRRDARTRTDSSPEETP